MQNTSTPIEQINAWDNSVVANFAAGEADILVVERNPVHDLDAALQESRIHEIAAPVSHETAGFEVRAGLSELRLKSPELEADIVNLVISFLNQFNIEEAKLRIEITQTQTCPKFHCDNVNVRLVTTYVGSTTEYQYAGQSEIHAAPLFGLVFLKGHQYPTHRDSVHHRSPAVPAGQRRLCIAIDL